MRPDEDERIFAALAHAGIVANVAGLSGLIGAAAIWATQRARSPFVRGHALQALVYQGAVLAISVLLTALWAACLALSLLPAAIRPDLYPPGEPPALFWLALAGLLAPLGFGVLATIFGLYGAAQAYAGRPFRYPLVGRIAWRAPDKPGGQPRAEGGGPVAPAPPESADGGRPRLVEPPPLPAPSPAGGTAAQGAEAEPARPERAPVFAGEAQPPPQESPATPAAPQPLAEPPPAAAGSQPSGPQAEERPAPRGARRGRHGG